MNIITIRADNIKRLVAAEVTPASNWVPITGKNGQGKTSLLDSILWALQGGDSIQGQPIRKGAKSARVKLSLGTAGVVELLVEKRFTDKGDYLFVRNADGSKRDAPQKTLDALTGSLTFDPIGFMHEKPKAQLETLRRLVPLMDEAGAVIDTDKLDKEFARLFQERTGVNAQLASAKARAEAISVPPDLPESPPDIEALMVELGEVSTFNGAIADKKRGQDVFDAETERLHNGNVAAQSEIEAVEQRLTALKERQRENVLMVDQRRASAHEALPEPKDAVAIQARISEARGIEQGLSLRTRKAEAEGEAEAFKEEADARTASMDAIVQVKKAALTRAKMPVEGLGFGADGVTFRDLPLEQASDAEQLRVSVAIAAAMNPKLRIMRIRDGNALDSDGRKLLATFAEEHDYQIWIELVDDTGELGVVIEDGHVKGQELASDEIPEGGASPGGTTGAPAAPAASEVTPERQAAADAYLAEALKALTECRTQADVEKLHAKVKVKLSAFPTILAEKWNPAKLAEQTRLANLARK